MFNDEDMEEMFLNFQVGDHMAMCFALIYLIDHGDDYPWLFRSGCCVMNECLFGLPWSIGKKEEGLEESRYYDIRCKKFEFAPEGWLDKQFNDVDFISRRNNDRDIAQMFYTLTGCVIPYGMPNPFDTKEYFSGLGLSPYESGFVSGAAYSLYMASKQATHGRMWKASVIIACILQIPAGGFVYSVMKRNMRMPLVNHSLQYLLHFSR